MSSITLPARKSPVRNEKAASTSSRITRGLIRALPSRLDARMALFLRHDVGAVFLQAPLGLRRRKAILRGVQFLQHLFGFTPGGFEKQR